MTSNRNVVKTTALFAFFLLVLCAGGTVKAAHTQLPNGVWRVYLTKPPVLVTQQTPVWCWAASLSALFATYGHPVDQRRIVATYFPPPGVTTGPPWVMRDALNRSWVDDNGKAFTISSAIYNAYPPAGPFNVDNASIVRALDQEVPVFYGDATHAMILVQADYYPTPGQPNIIGAFAADPYPNPITHEAWLRPLSPQELFGFFAGVPVSVK